MSNLQHPHPIFSRLSHLQKSRSIKTSLVLLASFVLIAQTLAGAFPASGQGGDDSPEQPVKTSQVYMPILTNRKLVQRVNVPYFADSNIKGQHFSEMAIFWFGQVAAEDNYTDVRIGYNDTELAVHMAIFDRLLWYQKNPAPEDLDSWDSAILYLSPDGNASPGPGPQAYRFVAQLNHWEERDAFQAGYHGNGSGWELSNISFMTESGWRGNTPNDDNNDRGWSATFHIPFASLGLSSAPPSGSTWNLGIKLHDRDSEVGPVDTRQSWPAAMDPNRPGSWGKLSFGLPAYSPPNSSAGGSITIRDKLNGAAVQDAAVGGTTGNLCPGGSNFIWNEWGNANFAGAAEFNIQNQSDVADWPCFAKYFVTFPLNTIPRGKIVRSATFTLHLFGGSDPTQAQPSLIQVLTAAGDWSESTLSWNGAPLPLENVSQAWVDPFTGPIVWPGAAWSWDLSYAVAQAYAAGQPLRLILYSADSAYHSGKYFVSSDTGDWNEAGRPTLEVNWGEP